MLHVSVATFNGCEYDTFMAVEEEYFIKQVL